MTFDRLMERLVGIFAIVVLAGGSLLVIAPFITALLWGAILAYSTWRPYQRLTAVLGGRNVWAAFLLVALILCVVLGPIFYAGLAFSAHVPDIAASVQARLAQGIPELPGWVQRLPFVGERISEAWTGLEARNPEMVERLRELAAPMLRGALLAALAVLQGLGLLALSVLFALAFYLGGDNVAAGLRGAMQRVAGARAAELLGLIGGTVKGVVYGILGTSLAQAILCTVGYWIAGLPAPALLGLATFFLAILPGGPLLIFVPGAIWLVQNGAAGWASFLVVWGAVVGITIDNVLKPILIGRSSQVPFVLVMLGVLGGAAAFGLLGVFIGPTLLAVTRTVMRNWTAGLSSDQAPKPAPIEHPRPATYAEGLPLRADDQYGPPQ